MRTHKSEALRILLAIIAMVFGLFVTSLAFGQETTQQTKPTETLEQRLVRQKAEEAKSKTGQMADPYEELVRLRAAQIELQEKLNKALKEVAKKDTKAMSKARGQLQKEADNLKKRHRDEAGTLWKAAITGCEPGTVTVDDRAVRSDTWNVMVQVRVVNATPLTYDIQTPFRNIGTAVRGLCPGGSITLSFVRNFVTDGLSEDVALIAVSQPVVGGVVTEERRFSLNVTNIQYRRVESQIWTLTRRQ